MPSHWLATSPSSAQMRPSSIRMISVCVSRPRNLKKNWIYLLFSPLWESGVSEISCMPIQTPMFRGDTFRDTHAWLETDKLAISAGVTARSSPSEATQLVSESREALLLLCTDCSWRCAPLRSNACQGSVPGLLALLPKPRAASRNFSAGRLLFFTLQKSNAIQTESPLKHLEQS